ncbi:MAG TPA: DUF819 family protein [Flavobacteriaceae bacterium]|nr:DUF819 family protein [Flavobacteriaceae bacterium]
MEIILTIFIVLFIPLLIKYTEKSKIVTVISPIALAYVAGILFSFSTVKLNQEIITQTTEISIALSICLFLLASNLDKFRTLLKPLLKSFFLGILSLLITIFLVYFLFGFYDKKYINIIGMLVGLYVGGTPNLNAIGIALDVPNETIVLVNTADIAFGGIYFLLLLTIVKPILSLFLPKYITGNFLEEELKVVKKTNLSENFKMIFLGFSTAIIILGFSFGLVFLMFDDLNIPAFLIFLTTLSIVGAQFSIIKKIKWKFEIAEVLLLIFSFGIGLQIDFNLLLTSGLETYLLVGSVFTGTILIHYLLAWITKTDVDTLLISSTAALYGPAFIAPIAKAIHNKELIVYGIALGLLGYILGNYLGLGIAFLLQLLS